MPHAFQAKRHEQVPAEGFLPVEGQPEEDASPLTVGVACLKSYEHTGSVRLSCEEGCTCKPRSVPSYTSARCSICQSLTFPWPAAASMHARLPGIPRGRCAPLSVAAGEPAQDLGQASPLITQPLRAPLQAASQPLHAWAAMLP